MNSNQTIRLIIADDHELLREGLSAVMAKEPSIELIATADNGAELVKLVQVHQPDVVLTDLVMPVMDGVEATRRIRQVSPVTEVIALSMFDDQSLVVDILEAGAIGYLLKNADKSAILEAIRCAANHQHYYSREISIKLARYVSQTRARQISQVSFTEKELEVIRYICLEFTTKEIGEQLFNSKRTVDGYRSEILRKTNARGTAGIVIYAIQHNLFSLDEKQNG
ncbi:MAG TPA: response regulator transcription factor [Chitinophagaceae bacterium]